MCELPIDLIKSGDGPHTIRNKGGNKGANSECKRSDGNDKLTIHENPCFLVYYKCTNISQYCEIPFSKRDINNIDRDDDVTKAEAEWGLLQ